MLSSFVKYIPISRKNVDENPPIWAAHPITLYSGGVPPWGVRSCVGGCAFVCAYMDLDTHTQQTNTHADTDTHTQTHTQIQYEVITTTNKSKKHKTLKRNEKQRKGNVIRRTIS